MIYNCEKSFDSENFTTAENGKVLGVTWHEKSDVLIFGLRDIFNAAVKITTTKRNILNIIASVYNPIGYVQPIVIKLKLLFQEVCLLNVSWSEVISKQLLQKKMVIIESLRECIDFKIKRCYYIYDFNDPVENFYLHGFSDSSLIAYGACVYLKTVTKSGNIYVSLLTSKSRIVPAKKKFTIPKLELLGNFILSNLINVVYNALSEEVVVANYFCWSDSSIALAWIKNVNEEYKVFIQNRVISICKNVDPDLWNYVSTVKNPADVITKFDSTSLNENIMCPKFLCENNLENDLLNKIYVSDNGDSLDENYYLEIQKHSLHRSVSTPDSIVNVIDIKTFSSEQRLYRVTGYALRFIENLERSQNKSNTVLINYVTVDELRNAKLLCLKSNQRDLEDEEEFKNIESCFRLFKVKDGLLHSKGRTGNSSLPYSSKSPILLSRKHYLTKLIALSCYNRVKHNGLCHTLAEVRSLYWTTKGKS